MRRQERDREREELRRRIANLRRERVEEREERAIPDGDERLRMLPGPPGRQKMMTGVLLIAVRREDRERDARSAGDRERRHHIEPGTCAHAFFNVTGSF